jgi:23S rRNA pseudouridine1911/1915/1917 synthase
MKEIIPKQSNIRLDTWLAQNQTDESRGFWQKKMLTGEVLVNGKKVKTHYKLTPEDKVTIKLKVIKNTMIGEDIPLDILFEDKNFAILNKPAGLVVHPGTGNPTHTLVHGLIHHYGGELSDNSGSNRPGIVHRLDKDTSGLLIIAKNNQSHRNISKQFEAKTIRKQYTALIQGHIKPKKGTIDAPLSRSKKNRQRISVSASPESRYAITHYEVIKYFETPVPCTLIKVTIETGRTHQIRVHFSSIEFPILGDEAYGNRNSNSKCKVLGLTRQFLHATELGFKSPTNKKEVHYTCPLSNDLTEFLKNCK